MSRQSDTDKPKRKQSPAQLANLRGGSRKGIPNKTTTKLKEAILEAGNLAGGDGGLAAYLLKQADANPAAFMTLLGKVLPMTLAGDQDNPLRQIVKVELTGS